MAYVGWARMEGTVLTLHMQLQLMPLRRLQLTALPHRMLQQTVSWQSGHIKHHRWQQGYGAAQRPPPLE